MKLTWPNSAVRFLAILMVSILVGCGDGADGGGNPYPGGAVDKVVATVRVVDGNDQTATVGTELPTALVALIKNGAGQPISGQIVNFVVASGGGSVFAGAALSDASGVARERWTMGTTAGINKVEIRAVASNGAAVILATFTATATAGAPLSVSISSGNNQSAQQSQPLQSPATVTVKDAYGNPVPGISVAFAASNGGSASPGSVATNATGSAATTWTLGQAIGAQTLSATVSGLPAVSFAALATSSSAGILKISGDLQSTAQYSFLSQPLVITVKDYLGNPIFTPVHFTTTTANGVTTTATVNTIAGAATSGVSTLYFNSVGQQQVVAIADGVTGSATFTVNVTAPNPAYPYDGLYDNIDITIINGVVGGNKYMYYFNGLFNETDGNISFNFSGGSITYFYVGRLLLGAQQQVTGSGTRTTSPGGVESPWTCTRR